MLGPDEEDEYARLREAEKDLGYGVDLAMDQDLGHIAGDQEIGNFGKSRCMLCP